jgi:hypothetical protein
LSFGVGFAIVAAAMWIGVRWYKLRPQPWVNTALSGSFGGVEFKTQPHEDSYLVEFLYDIENHTNMTQFEGVGRLVRRQYNFGE